MVNLLLLALVPACFALNPVIGRALIDSFGPASLSVVRWSLSAVVIAAVAAARGSAERWRAERYASAVSGGRAGVMQVAR